MQPDDDHHETTAPVSLTLFIESNQRLLSVLSVFIAVIVVSGQIDSGWANVFRGTFVLLALIVWLELVSNHHAMVDWWKMPRHSLRPREWLGLEQRMYWFGLIVLIGFLLFCVYFLVNFPVASFYVLLAVLHTPVHVFLMRLCLRMRFLRGRSEKSAESIASALSGGLTLLLLVTVAVLVKTIAGNVT
jgi:hypothetical protein